MIKVDDRDRQDILEELRERARSYTPEWKFDTAQPDAAAANGLIFSHQMMENVHKRNQMMERYRIEFANMYGLSRRPAIPARTICSLRISDAIQDGVGLPAGTQVIGMTDGGEEIVFAFTEDVCAVRAELKDIIETSERYSLFPRQGRGLRRQAVVMCFRSFPDLREQKVSLCFRGNILQMTELFADGTYFALSAALEEVDLHRFFSMHKKELQTALDPDGQLAISCEEPLPTVSVNGEEMTVLILEMKRLPAERINYQNILINSIEVFTVLQSGKPDFIWNGREEETTGRFFPFGRQPALYDECLIGQDALFGQKGTLVSLRFRLEFERYRPHRGVETPPDLRIVRRKPRADGRRLICDECRVDEVSFTYFNGKGWRRLALDLDGTLLFSGEENAGEYQICFEVPGDWERVAQGGYEGRCIRIQIIRADNCYLQEVEYVLPVLSDITLCAEGQEKGIMPDFAAVVRGTEAERVPDRQAGGFCAFEQEQYRGEYVYLGFDRVFRQGPVSMLVELERTAEPGMEMSFAYSDGRDFKPLKMIDHTNAFQNPGILQFAPPVDMAESEVDGVRRCWLRLQLRKPAAPDRGNTGQEHMPVVRRIHMNAVTAENIIAEDEQDHYIDAAVPDMHFPLYAENILSVQVWVNEKEQLTEEERDRLMRDARQESAVKVRAEYNFLGEIEDFYVLWHEIDSFDQAVSGERCYCVDRGRNELVFGDGAHVRIPQNTTSIAFKTRVLCCDGEKANIRAGSIERFRSTVIAVEQVMNPIDAYGGTDLERLQHTLGRGSSILSARGRVVTEQDFVREALAFSDVVAQAACVVEEDGVVRLVLLMRDHQKGDHSFRRIQKSLTEHMIDCCETICGKTLVRVCLPVFVKISIKVWLNVPELSKSIEIRQRWLDRMTAFLEPVDEQGGIRWQIGRLPGTRQIRLMLGGLERTARIAHMDVLAQYFDGQHTVERELDAVRISPFMVCSNGTHRIFVVGDTYAQEY